MSPDTRAILIPLIVGIVMSAVAFAWGRVGRSRDRKSDEVLRKEALAIEAVKERDERISHLERVQAAMQSQLDAQNKAAVPIQAAMEAMLLAKLTNDHTPEADALLKKHIDKTLTAADAAKFAQAMTNRETEMDVSESQRIAARILPDIIRLREIAEESPEAEVRTVLVTVPETETKSARDGGTQEEEKGN